MTTPDPHIPWYKNYILILIIIVPFLTVCGSAVTIYLALSSKESSVMESYQKQGLAPGKHSIYANDIAITGNLDPAQVVITLDTEPPISEPLTLVLEHATRADADQTHTLQAFAPNTYPLTDKLINTLIGQKWYVRLRPAENPTWELQGISDVRHQKNAKAVALTLHE